MFKNMILVTLSLTSYKYYFEVLLTNSLHILRKNNTKVAKPKSNAIYL